MFCLTFFFVGLGLLNLVCSPEGLVVCSLFIRSCVRLLLNMSLVCLSKVPVLRRLHEDKN